MQTWFVYFFVSVHLLSTNFVLVIVFNSSRKPKRKARCGLQVCFFNEGEELTREGDDKLILLSTTRRLASCCCHPPRRLCRFRRRRRRRRRRCCRQERLNSTPNVRRGRRQKEGHSRK